MIEEVRKVLAEADAQYASTLGTFLRSYVDDEHLDRAIEVVRRLVLAIPTSLELLVDLARLPGASPAVGNMAREALAYVQEPEDLLPESRYGLYGYLDDAYLVHGLVTLAYESLPPTARSRVTVEDERFTNLEKLTRLGGKLLPPKVRFELDSKKSALHAGLLSSSPHPTPPSLVAEVSAAISLERFAQRLTARLSEPHKGEEPRFGAIASDAGAWKKSAHVPVFPLQDEAADPAAAATPPPADPGVPPSLALARLETGPVRLVVHFRVKAGKVAAFLFAMNAAIRGSLGEEGCRQYLLTRSLDDERTFVLLEEWVDGAALTQHAAMPHSVALRAALDGVLEGPPTLQGLRPVPLGT